MSTKISSLLISQVIFGTLRNVVNEFIVDRKTRGLSPRTVQYYNDELRYFSDYMDLIGVEKFTELQVTPRYETGAASTSMGGKILR